MKINRIMLITVIAGLIYSGWMSALLFSSALTKGKGKMSGVVTDQDTGNPIAGVTVKLFMAEIGDFHQPFPKTDAEGKWSVYYVRKGRWDLDFVKDGYEVKKISYVVDPTPGTKNPPIELQLKKLEGPAVGQEIMKEIAKANNLMVEKKYDEALKDLLAIHEKYQGEPGIEIVYVHIGNCYSLKGDYQKAIQYYLKSQEKFPNNKEIILSIGNAYNNLQDFAKALEWFNKLKVDEIGNVDTLYNIGVIAYNNNNFEQALTYFKKATEIDNQFADGFFQLGMTYIGMEKNQEGIVALKKFMELAPDSPNYETAKAVVDAFK
jgi:predicted Zn-dependent protease